MTLPSFSLAPPALDKSPPLPADASDVILKMYYVQCLAAGTYIVAHKGFAVVVDPIRDVDEYCAFLEKNNLRLKGILLSHVHADYLGGHAELSRRTNAPIFYGHKVPGPEAFGMSASDARPGIAAVHEGDTLHLSSEVKLRAMETPGHTPGCITWVLEKSSGTGSRFRWKSLAAFTGDTLFIGSCGRPDLVGLLGITKEQMAGFMCASLKRLVDELPPECLILPAHGAGSPCGKALSDKLFESLGAQLGKFPCGRSANEPLRKALEDNTPDGKEFVEYLVGSQILPPAPDYFLQCIKDNVGCAAPNLKDRLKDIPAQDFKWLATAQASNDFTIIDTREPDEFMPCHVKGSINFALGTHGGNNLGHEDGNFGLWVGSMSDLTKKLVVVIDEERRQETFVRLARVAMLGFVEGYVDTADFKTNSEAAGVILSSRHRWTVDEIKKTTDLKFLDVRTPGEFSCKKGGTIKGAVNVQLGRGIKRGAEEAGLDKSSRYVAFCAGGFRSAIAASFLNNEGYQVEDIKYGYPIVKDEIPSITTIEPAP